VQLHRRIAEVLREHRGTTGDTQPELLAWHYTLAGLPELAIGQWRLAGEESVARFANREAISHFGRALDLLQALALGPERDRLEADLCLEKVVPLIAINGFGSQAVELCATRANELSDAPVESPRRFAARRVVWNSSLLRQPVPKTVALARDLLAIADQDGDPARRAEACRALGYSLFIAGEQVEADPLLNEGIVIQRTCRILSSPFTASTPRSSADSTKARFGGCSVFRTADCKLPRRALRGHVRAAILMLSLGRLCA